MAATWEQWTEFKLPSIADLLKGHPKPKNDRNSREYIPTDDDSSSSSWDLVRARSHTRAIPGPGPRGDGVVKGMSLN